MTGSTTLTFAIMDAPFESARTATAFRLMDIAASRGYQKPATKGISTSMFLLMRALLVYLSLDKKPMRMQFMEEVLKMRITRYLADGYRPLDRVLFFMEGH